MSGILERLQSPKAFALGVAALGAAYYGRAPMEVQCAAAGFAITQVAIAVLRVLGGVLGKIYSWLRPSTNIAPQNPKPQTSSQSPVASRDSSKLEPETPAAAIALASTALPPVTPELATSKPEGATTAAVAATAATSLSQPAASAPSIVVAPAASVAASLPVTPVVAIPVATAAPAAVSTLAVPSVLKIDAATSPTPPGRYQELGSFKNSIVTFSVGESEEPILPGPGETVICAVGEGFDRKFSFSSLEGNSSSKTKIVGSAVQSFVAQGTYKRLAQELLLLKNDKFVFMLQSTAWSSRYDTMSLARYIEEAFDPDQNKIISKAATSKTIRLIFPDQEKARSYLSSRQAKTVVRRNSAADTAAAPQAKFNK